MDYLNQQHLDQKNTYTDWWISSESAKFNNKTGRGSLYFHHFWVAPSHIPPHPKSPGVCSSSLVSCEYLYMPIKMWFQIKFTSCTPWWSFSRADIIPPAFFQRRWVKPHRSDVWLVKVTEENPQRNELTLDTVWSWEIPVSWPRWLQPQQVLLLRSVTEPRCEDAQGCDTVVRQ